MHTHRLAAVFAALMILLIANLTVQPSAVQLPQKPSLPGGLSAEDLKALKNLPSLKDLIGGAPLTTSLADAVTDVPFLDRFDPVAASPLLELPFGLDGGVTLVPGMWQSELEGFCLQAGTRGPTRGDGYVWAPLKGPKADVIASILNGLPRLDNTETLQHDAQILLWAILARSKLSTLDAGPRRVADALLSKAQLASIDTSALDVLPSDLLDRILGPAAAPVRAALDTENKLRDVLAEPGEAAYERLEELAVPTNLDVPAPKGREVPSGRWSLTPAGAFVRYLPTTYSELTLQLYVPEAFAIASDAAGHITDLTTATGTTLAIEYGGDAITRVTLSAAGAATRAIFVSHVIPRNAPAVTNVVAAAARLVPAARRQTQRATDLASLTQLALSVDDADAASLLNRAWASALSDWAATPAPAKSLVDIPHARVVTVGFVRPMATPQRGSTFFGGGRNGFSCGSGAGAPGNRSQREGCAAKPLSRNNAPARTPPPKDDAMSRARRATDMGIGRIGRHVPYGGWGFDIPRQVLKKGLDELYDAARKIANALEGDPPRQDFRQFGKPDVPIVAPVEPGPDLSAAEAANYSALVRHMTEMNAYMRAGLVAIDRHGGAVQAGDRAWASQQAQALIYLKRQAGLIALKVSADLEKFGADAQRSVDQFRDFGQYFASLPEVPAPWK